MAGIGTKAEATAVPTNVSTETAILTVPFSTGNASNVSLAAPPNVGAKTKNRINGVLNLTPGTATTACVVKCRQGAGTTTGTQVGQTQTTQVIAADPQVIGFEFSDPAPNFGQAYTITVAQTNGTGAGTVTDIVAYVTDYT